MFMRPALLCALLLTGCNAGISGRHTMILGAGYIVLNESNQIAEIRVFGIMGGNFLGKLQITNRTESVPPGNGAGGKK